MEIHFPPNCLCIGRFNLSAIRYILGTMTSVMKNAKVNPNIIVQASGFQKEALSPPKKICGFNSENMVTKLILNPMANGKSAAMDASEVNNTGIILILPACITASFGFMPLPRSSSAKSITRIAFFTTIPARPTIPIPVITKGDFRENNNRLADRIKLEDQDKQNDH